MVFDREGCLLFQWDCKLYIGLLRFMSGGRVKCF